MPARPLTALAVLLAVTPACSDGGADSDAKGKRGDGGEKKAEDEGDADDEEADGGTPKAGKRSSLAAAVREATEKARNRGTAAKRVCDKLRALAEDEGTRAGDDDDMAECVRELEAKGKADAARLGQLARCMDRADDMERAMTCLMDDARRDDRYEGKMGDRKEDAKAWDRYDEKMDEKKEDRKAFEYTSDGGW